MMPELVPNPLLVAALGCAARGWKVFPLWWPIAGGCACNQGATCERAAKHPLARLAPNGLKDATSDEYIIRGWWAQYPLANVAIRTGAESGLWALDVDAYRGGAASLEALEDKHGPLPASLRARTGSGGASTHIYFTWPAGLVVRSRPIAAMGGLDVKGHGGYVVAPPSLHRSGGVYTWLDEDDSTLEAAPGWLLALVASPPAAEPQNPIPTGLELPDEDAADFCEEFFKRAARKVSGGEARHDTAVWFWTQCKDNGVPVGIAQSWVDPYLDLCRDEGAERQVPEEELRRVCAWAYSQPRRDPIPAVARRLMPPEAPDAPEGTAALVARAATLFRKVPAPFPWIDLHAFRAEAQTIERTRHPTGFPTFDLALRGGLPGGVVVSLVGPPGSCKSVWAIQLGLDRARTGGGSLYVYSPDQGGNQPLTRLAQAFGDVTGDDDAFARFCAEYGPLIRVADEREPGVNLESFAAAVAAAGDAAAVVIDTPQTVATAADDDGERARIDSAMDTARLIASRQAIPVISASHANRAGTAARKKEDRIHPRASALGSAKIEHRSQVVVFMERVDREDALTEVEALLTKVSFGSAGKSFRMLLDPATWRLREVDQAASVEEDGVQRAIARDRKVRGWCDKLAKTLRKNGPMSVRNAREAASLSGAEFRAAREAMEAAGTLRTAVKSGQGGGVLLHLAGEGVG